MTEHNDECSSALEDFLSAPPFDPEFIIEEPLLRMATTRY